MAQPVHISVLVRQIMAQLAGGQPLGDTVPIANGGPDGRGKLLALRHQIKERGIHRTKNVVRSGQS